MNTRNRWPGPTKREKPARERAVEYDPTESGQTEPLTADPLNSAYDPDVPNPPMGEVPREVQSDGSATVAFMVAGASVLVVAGIAWAIL